MVSGENVYVATMNGRLVAMRVSDGKALWTYRSPSAFSASPLVMGGRVFIGDEGGEFHAVDSRTGRRLWKIETGDKIVGAARPFGDTVIFGSYDTHVYAVRADTGRPVWKAETEGQVHASPTVVDGRVLVAGCDGYLRAFEARRGTSLFSIKLGGNHTTPPVVRQGVAYVANSEGEVSAVDLARRRTLWRIGEREEGAGVYAAMDLAGSRLIIPSRSNRVYALDVQTRRVTWTLPLRRQANAPPTVVGERAWFGTDEGVLYGVRVSDGRVVASVRLGGKLRSGVVPVGDGVILGGDDGRVRFLVPVR